MLLLMDPIGPSSTIGTPTRRPGPHESSAQSGSSQTKVRWGSSSAEYDGWSPGLRMTEAAVAERATQQRAADNDTASGRAAAAMRRARSWFCSMAWSWLACRVVPTWARPPTPSERSHQPGPETRERRKGLVVRAWAARPALLRSRRTPGPRDGASRARVARAFELVMLARVALGCRPPWLSSAQCTLPN